MTPQRMREIADKYVASCPSLPHLTDCPVCAGIAAELRAHADQLERNGEWQPISTAPNTKEEVLIFELPNTIRVATRIPDTNTYLDGTTYGIYDTEVEFFPTHWMPLPKPPKAK